MNAAKAKGKQTNFWVYLEVFRIELWLGIILMSLMYSAASKRIINNAGIIFTLLIQRDCGGIELIAASQKIFYCFSAFLGFFILLHTELFWWHPW